MFDWVPGPVAAVIGSALMLFILIAGISATSKNKKGGKKGNDSTTNSTDKKE